MTIEYTIEEIQIIKNIMCFFCDEASWYLENFDSLDDNKILKCEILFYKKEIDFDLFKKMYADLFK
ncbi:MAG: hypothetical protein LBK94_05040 [Prevotellaceae bacterium]|jgi:hypothetical protein|nr:hypothetical protein [Prevotellaceae bacterium]